MQKFSETIYKGLKSVNNSVVFKYAIIIVGLYCALFFSFIIINSHTQSAKLWLLLLLILLSSHCAITNIIELFKLKKMKKE